MHHIIFLTHTLVLACAVPPSEQNVHTATQWPKTQRYLQYHRNVVDRHRFDVNPDLDPTPSFTHDGKSVFFLLLITTILVSIVLSFSSASFGQYLEIFGNRIVYFTFSWNVGISVRIRIQIQTGRPWMRLLIRQKPRLRQNRFQQNVADPTGIRIHNTAFTKIYRVCLTSVSSGSVPGRYDGSITTRTNSVSDLDPDWIKTQLGKWIQNSIRIGIRI